MPLYYGGPGAAASLAGLPGTNEFTLPPGGCWPVPPGWWEAKPGPYSNLQVLDGVTGNWLLVGAGSVGANGERIRSDGQNYRFCNPTGCVVGANVTAGGSGYTPSSPPVVTAAAGGAILKAVVGGAVGSVPVTNGGSGYVYAPLVIFSAPPGGGVQATGHAVLTAGAVSSIVVDNQGAGYLSPPTVTFINDPREGQNNLSIGTGAAAVATLAGTGQVTAVLALDHGSPVTAIPALSFSGGSGSGAAATALMDWCVLSAAVSGGGTAYVAPVNISHFASPVGGSAFTNPAIQQNLVRKRNGIISPTLSGGVIQPGTQVLVDGGVYDSVPAGFIAASGAGSGATFGAPTMGGVVDTCRIYPG